VLRDLVEHGYPGPVYPVNPTATAIRGLRCYPTIGEVPDPVDLAVIIIPAPAVPEALEGCGRRGVRAAIVISGGFGELGPEGEALERQIVEIARRHQIRLIGPNCIGVIDTITPLDTTFVGRMPVRGTIAFVSHSGAICGGVIDIAYRQGIGFSRFVSLGNQADVNETEVLAFLTEDPHSQVVAAYLEGVADGGRFLEVARRLTARKPFIVLKAGRTGGGVRAAASHTGALAGSDRAFEAAFRKAGILRADTLEELLDYATALAYQPPPRGERVAVVTNAGGPGILAVDALERAGLRLASLAPETGKRLAARLPRGANVHNPVDLLGGAYADDYAFALDTVLEDPGVDAALVILVPQALVSPVDVANAIGNAADRSEKPIVAAFVGDASTEAGVQAMHRRRVPVYPFPERAARALAALRLDARRRQPHPEESPPEADVARAAAVIRQAQAAGQRHLLGPEARTVVEAYGLRVPASGLARTAAEAVALARRIGYPVALKVHAPEISHKSDVGGVVLGVRDEAEVRAAFAEIVDRARRYVPGTEVLGVMVQAMVPAGREVIVGASRDRQFGPLVAFGLGGIFVEALGDVSFRLAPVSRDEAREMIRETRAARVLAGIRGEPPADVEAIVEAIRRVGRLVLDFPAIAELDLNPLIVGAEGEGAWAVDVRLVLSP